MHKISRIKDFHADRLRGVGSSDMVTLVGLNARFGQTPLTLWREKTGRAKGFEGNERTEWGNYLEPLILKKYVTDRYGPELGQEFYRNLTRSEPVNTGQLKIKTECWHPKAPFAMAHADLVDLTGTPVIVEAKSTGFYAGKRREGGKTFEGYDEDDTSQAGIPDKVFVQVQWQLFCYGITEALVAVLIDTSRYRTYGPIIADPRRQEEMLALAERFWWHVEHDKEPQPTTWDDVVSLSPTLEDASKALVGGDVELQALAMIDEGHKLKARREEIEERLEDIKMALGLLAGDVEEVEEGGRRFKRWTGTAKKFLTTTSGDVLVRFRDQRRETLTMKAVMEPIEKKLAKAASNAKKVEAGKTVKPEDIEAATLTDADREVLALEAKLRALGCYRTSEAARIVTY